MPTLPRIQGYAEQGGHFVIVSGMSSTPVDYQQSYPGATITIHIAGTGTLASLFSDSGGVSPQANPFTADATGYWSAYLANGSYDVTFSGTGITAPFTISAISVLFSTGNFAFTDVANVFTKNQTISYGTGVSNQPLFISCGDTSGSFIINSSTAGVGFAALTLFNSTPKNATFQIIGPSFGGTVYAGGPSNNNNTILSSGSNDIVFIQSGSDGNLWFATNSATRAKLNSTALESTVPLKLDGATSGSNTIKAQDIAGTYTFLLPNTDPVVNQTLYVSAFSGGIVTLSYLSSSPGTTSYQGRAKYDAIATYNASGSNLTTTGTMTSGSPNLTLLAARDFINGQGILVAGAGAAGKNLVAKILSGAGTVNLVLDTNCGTSQAGVKVQHDDSVAINTALAAISTAGGGVLLLKNGIYRCNGPLDVTCNGILQLPQITRISAAPISITLMGESTAPITGSSILPTLGVIIDSQDFDGSVSNFGAILSGKAYASTATVTNTTFNYTQVCIENITFRNKPNPFLSGINCNNTEGLIMSNSVVDAGEAVTFTSSGFTVNTQPTHTTAAAILSPGLNNICANHLANVTVTGYFYGIVVGDNLRFNGGVYVIFTDTGLYFPGNAAMVQGPIGIYLTKNPIVITNTLGVNSALNLDLEVQIINTGTWYDVAANRTIYDPGNFGVGTITGIMPGNTGYTGCAGLDILDTYNKTYQYGGIFNGTPFFKLTNTVATSPGNQIELLTDSGAFAVISLSGSLDPTTSLREKLNIYTKNDIIFNAGLSSAADIHFQSGGVDQLSISHTLGLVISAYAASTKTITWGVQTIALAAGATTTVDMIQGNIWEMTFGAGNTTLGLANIIKGTFTLALIQDATGSRTMTWPASFKWIGGTAPTLSTGAGKRDVIEMYSNGTNQYQTSTIALDVR